MRAIRLMLVTVVCAGGVATAAEAQGVVCSFDGVVTYDTDITTVSTDFAYSFEGTLGCGAAPGSDHPSAGSIQAGGSYVVDGAEHVLAAPSGHGGCATSDSSGLAVIDWEDGTRTVMAYDTHSVTGAGVLTGRVVAGMSASRGGGGAGAYLATTRDLGYHVSGAFGFEADPLDCVDGGRSALIHGLSTLRPGAGHVHSICTFESAATFSPGVDPVAPSSGTFASQWGTASCSGTVTGVGDLSYDGWYGPGDTCDAGMGGGNFRFTVGPQVFEGTFIFERVGAASVFRGAFDDGGTIFGTTQTIATTGDCITTPITEARILDQTEIR